MNHHNESSRRAFIKAAAATAALAGLSDFSKVLAQPQGEADKKLSILILPGRGLRGGETRVGRVVPLHRRALRVAAVNLE